MELSLFFLKDKVLANGTQVIDISELDSVRKDLLSGILVVRKMNENSYILSVNQYYEKEICRLLERSDRNTNSRAYKLLGCREPMVIEALIKRIDCGHFPAKVDNVAWWSVLEVGVYSATLDSISSAMLDYMVFNDLVEYEAYNTYSMSGKFIGKILEKDEVYMSWLEKYLKCDDVGIVRKFMTRHGYCLKGKKFSKLEFEPIGFLV